MGVGGTGSWHQSLAFTADFIAEVTRQVTTGRKVRSAKVERPDAVVVLLPQLRVRPKKRERERERNNWEETLKTTPMTLDNMKPERGM